MRRTTFNYAFPSTRTRSGMEPPRVFISYRWESEIHMEWVRSFVEGLKKRRVTALFDQDVHNRHGGKIDSETLREIIGSIGQAHVFIPILTPAYLQGIGAEGGRLQTHNPYDGWVFDEFQISLKLGKERSQETLPVLRRGEIESLPYGFHAGNTLDMRDDGAFDKNLDVVAEYLAYQRSVEKAPRDVRSADPVAAEYAANLTAAGTEHFNRADYEKAKGFYERAIALTAGDASTAAAYKSNLALTMNMLGRLDDALGLFNCALEIKRRELGPNHPEVAAILNNLGLLYCDRDEYEKAIDVLKDALAIKERIPNADQHDIAISLNSLAHVFHKLGRYGEALPLYERAATIAARILPANHSDVKLFKANLARCREKNQ